MSSLEEQILFRLRDIPMPGYQEDIVSLGFVKKIEVDDTSALLQIVVQSEQENIDEVLRPLIREKVESVPGIERVKLTLLVQKPQTGKKNDFTPDPSTLSDVRFKIAVASGKGGVGKSTVAVNLACALVKSGWEVGMFDADVYGPSQHIMLDIGSEKPRTSDDSKIIPLQAGGMKVMTMGSLVEKDAPVIWRGPMVMKLVEQFITDVDWGVLDAMIIDLPPGTGDAQLTLCQTLSLSGVVIVTTPQDVALVDARKGLNMFRKLNVPILGIVENMSTFHCPHCGQETPIFGKDGAVRTAKELKVPLLAQVPLDARIPESGDSGRPIVLTNEESPVAVAFMNAARAVRTACESRG